MKISVIIATFNTEKYIGRAIRSCLDQSIDKSEYEIIVVDDGSTDNTGWILSSFADWIKVVMGDNQGLASARNAGIRRSLGQFVVMVDADDFIHEDLLRTEFLFLAMNREIDAVACDYFTVDKDENILERRNCFDEPIACGIMFRKDKLVDVGLYNKRFKVWEDLDLRARWLMKFNIHRLPLPLYKYRMREGSLSSDSR